jgi:hypothetical protein
MSRPGWVYVLTHPAWEGRGLVKIGKTTQDPARRAAQITSVSGLLAPCSVAWCAWVSDLDRVETAAHRILDRHRARQRRELFHVDVETAKQAILSADSVRFSAVSVRRRLRRSRTYPQMERYLAILLAAAAVVAWRMLH